MRDIPATHIAHTQRYELMAVNEWCKHDDGKPIHIYHIKRDTTVLLGESVNKVVQEVDDV